MGEMINQCGMLGSMPQVYIQLGRYGDIILLLPAFYRMWQLTGRKPLLIVSTAFASVLEGVSYVEPFPLDCDFYGGMPMARQLAQEQFGGATVLQCNGAGWSADVPAPNYMTSMWRRTGFTDEEMRALPLVFDRRSEGREAQLLRWVLPARVKLPILLVNFEGVTSRFAAVPEVMAVVNEYRGRFHIIDLGKIKASRIYDLLGLYEIAAGLITSDTATLHLAAASKVPYVGYTANGGGSSVVKGNCVLEIKYKDVLARLSELRPQLEWWSTIVPSVRQTYTVGGRGMMRA